MQDQLTERLRLHFTSGFDIPEALDQALADIGLPAKWRDVLYGPLTKWAIMVRNDFDHSASREIAASIRVPKGQGGTKVVKPGGGLSDFQRITQMRFDGACGRVTFGEATHEDYVAKIAALDIHIEGTVRTRTKFEVIDEFLVERNARCIDALTPSDRDDFLALYAKVAA